MESLQQPRSMFHWDSSVRSSISSKQCFDSDRSKPCSNGSRWSFDQLISQRTSLRIVDRTLSSTCNENSRNVGSFQSSNPSPFDTTFRYRCFSSLLVTCTSQWQFFFTLRTENPRYSSWSVAKTASSSALDRSSAQCLVSTGQSVPVQRNTRTKSIEISRCRITVVADSLDSTTCSVGIGNTFSQCRSTFTHGRRRGQSWQWTSHSETERSRSHCTIFRSGDHRSLVFRRSSIHLSRI